MVEEGGFHMKKYTSDSQVSKDDANESADEEYDGVIFDVLVVGSKLEPATSSCRVY